MKILVCFENRVRPDSTGGYFLTAFKSLGHEVTHVLPENIMDVKPGSYDFYFKCDDGIYSPWNEKLSPSAYYCIDSHIETDWRLKIEEQGNFDHVYVCHRDGLQLPWVCKNITWLPVACDPEAHYAGKAQKKYDTCFIGNFHSQYAGRRVDMVDELFRCTPNFFFGNRTFRDMAKKYAESKIVFNCSLNNDANMRVFEAMCSGSCLLTDRVQDLTALGFVEGVHYEGYKDAEELRKKVYMLLGKDDYRESLAENARTYVLSKHTYAHRCEVILSQVKEKELCPLP